MIIILMDKSIKSVNSCKALASQDQEDKTPSISTLPYNGKVRSRVDSSFFKVDIGNIS